MAAHRGAAEVVASSLSLLWTAVPETPAALQRRALTARAVARIAHLLGGEGVTRCVGWAGRL